MRVWIVTPGEPAVFHPDIAGMKIMRSAALAQTLARRGHEVIWWTGSFQHHSKLHLTPADCSMETDIPGLSLWLVSSPGYDKNISFARFRDYRILTKNWLRAAETLPKPDVIVASWPPVDLGCACVTFGQKYDCKVVLDVRDLWPDIIYERLKQKMRLPWVPRFLRSYNTKTGRSFSKATAVMGITNAFVQWGCDKGQRQKNERDRAFYLSSYSLDKQDTTGGHAKAFWSRHGLDLSDEKIVFAWVGSLIKQKSILKFLSYFSNLPVEVQDRVQLIICGSGTLEKEIKVLAENNSHIIFPGFINKEQYSFLLKYTDYGALIYDPTFDFVNSIPNKVNEYLSGGVKIFTNLNGEAYRILSPENAVDLICISSQENFSDDIDQVIQKGKLSSESRMNIKQVYEKIFSGEILYSKMADHVEFIYSYKKNDKTN